MKRLGFRFFLGLVLLLSLHDASGNVVFAAAIPIITSVSEDDSCCPRYKYIKMLRSVVSCSNGTYNDSGWSPGGTAETCGEDPAPEGSTDCQYWTEPGSSLGDDDVTCSFCQYVEYYLNETDSSECCDCEASDVTYSYTVELPTHVNNLMHSIKGLAKTAPMIKELEIGVEGQCKLTKGEECCQDEPCDPPVTYGDWNCSASCAVSVELNVPGWHWKVHHSWKGLYYIHGSIFLGPTVTVSPSASASLSGREYYGDCLGCMQVNGNLSIGIEVEFKGEIKLVVLLECWPHTSFSASGEVGLGLSSSITGSGYQKWGGCSGQKVCVSIGALEGKAFYHVEFLGFSVNWEETVTFLPGWQGCM